MQKGMSLMECLVSLAIVGILVSIAMPSYRLQQLKGHRSAAQARLTSYALEQGEYRLDHPSYADATQLGVLNTGRYQFEVAQFTGTKFLLRAKAINQQIGDSGCETLLIDQSMLGQPKDCW